MNSSAGNRAEVEAQAFTSDPALTLLLGATVQGDLDGSEGGGKYRELLLFCLGMCSRIKLDIF